MSKSRTIQTKMWTDTWFEGLDVSQKLLFIYLLTNEKTNMLGIYEISIRKMSFDTGIDKDTINKTLEQFKKDDKIFYKESHIIISNFLKNQSYNPNMKKSAINTFNELPNSLKGLDKVLDTSDISKAWVSLYESLGKAYLMLPKIEVEAKDETKPEIEIYNTTPAEAEECVNHSFKNQSPPQEKEKEKSSAKKEKEIFDWDKLLEFINNNTGRSFKVINKAVRSKYKARLRDGYTKDDIISVITNAPKTEFHKENNCQYCTPEYFSRADIIDKYSEVTKNDSETTVAPKMNT